MFHSNTISGTGDHIAICKVFMTLPLILLGIVQLDAQESLFENLNGNVLIDSLTEAYKPSQLMTYGPARDSMYLKVYREADGEVECLYSGHRIFLPLNVDPSTFLYNDEDPLGITAEHIYPQSKGAGAGNARSDMHSLVPAIWRVNEGRSNYPFGEIPDEETDNWYYKTEDLRSTIPSMLIDQYSEKLNGGFGNIGKFEPRESTKGNVARAVFYFYTMYKEEADRADPDYFHEMKEVLFQWHLEDPVDSLEYIQNFKKAVYQEGKINPFINDCTLVGRAYFDGANIDCTEYLSATKFPPDHERISIAPNPVHSTLNIEYDNANGSSFVILDVTGRKMLEVEEGVTAVDVSMLSKGLYFIKLSGESFGKAFTKV